MVGMSQKEMVVPLTEIKFMSLLTLTVIQHSYRLLFPHPHKPVSPSTASERELKCSWLVRMVFSLHTYEVMRES